MFNQMKSGGIDGYSYYISSDSDDEACRGSDSSEDEKQYNEIDVFLHGTPKQQKKALQRLAGNEASSSEDEFEKMMKEELDDKMALHEQSWMQGNNDKEQPSSSTSKPPSSSATYDDIYFDSDEDNDDKRVKAKKKKLSNDELFYDPFADDRNQRWVNKQRVSRGSSVGEENPSSKPAPADSNPVLTCPACLTTLCMDCQRHDVYKDQYRAMFVMNCKVLRDEILRYKEPKKRKFKRHRKQEAAAMATAQQAGFSSDVTEGSEQIFHPVKCDKCDTEVAVFDDDEIYHFFNVIAGPA